MYTLSVPPFEKINPGIKLEVVLKSKFSDSAPIYFNRLESYGEPVFESIIDMFADAPAAVNVSCSRLHKVDRY